MIVRTFEGLQALTTPQPTWGTTGGGSVNLYDHRQTYFEIFRTQPNIRICVEFFARNIADVPLHAFRRISDTDRERLPDHDLVRWLAHPNPGTTGYRLIDDLLMDWGIYQKAFWLKVRYVDAERRDALGFVRLPPEEMRVEGGLIPTEFVWTTHGREKRFAPSEIVHFAGYRLGISPLETLRRILAEEAAAGDHREAYWRNASRHEGIVERPKDAGKWTPAQRVSWREQWQERFAGAGNAGRIPVLEDGMHFVSTSFSAKDSEYTVGGKLRREVCAAMYQIPQPFVGILDHATFSNIKEQHKNLYQDCLGPTFRMLIQELKRQVLIECRDQRDVYLEFNIDAKLAGTPEDRAGSIFTSTGRAWRTVAEARALDNLPRIDDPTLDTVAPQQGGPSDATAQPTARRVPMMTRPNDVDDVDARTVPAVLQAHRTRQQARLDKLPLAARSSIFFAEADRWMRELTTDLTPICGAADAVRFASEANTQLFLALDTEEVAA